MLTCLIIPPTQINKDKKNQVLFRDSKWLRINIGIIFWIVEISKKNWKEDILAKLINHKNKGGRHNFPKTTIVIINFKNSFLKNMMSNI